MGDKGRVVGDDRLGHVLLVSTPEGKPDEFVLVGRGDGGQAVKAVVNPLEVPHGLVVVQVSVAVTYFLGLFCGEITALLVCKSSKGTGHLPRRTSHAKSSNFLG